ncbi:hypothetical protein [Sphingomonas soli]|uniref:hypothetical protein n=1 Tax=Sphingomonas soli TaxID=266127 RepID=UPI00082FC831|nr:hypothetical protein [Sphingomonas soli]
MKSPTIRPRAALFIGAALLSTPAFAQDVPAQTVTPPPIMVTPAPTPAAPAQRVIQMQPQAPVVQAVPETPVATTPAAPARTTATTTRQTRSAAPVRAAAPVREAAPAPVAAPAPGPVTETPAAPVAAVPKAVTPPPVVETQPLETSVATTSENERGGIAWGWLLGGIALVIAGIAAAMLMRRRDPEYVEEHREPAAVAPVAAPFERRAAAEPVARTVEPEPAFAGLPPAIPLAEPEVREAQAAVATAEDVSISEPEKEDLAGVVDGAAPVSRRPWIELGMRPVRAGTNKEEAVVDFELTVGNSGDTSAKDVRISTFMLADGATESEIESLMIEHRDDNAVSPVTIEPGEGTRVDAHLAVPKGDLGRTFNPVVVAEARYTLPDGRQGRTAAAFRIGTASENGVGPLAASRPFVTETVEAELFGVPEHA